MVLAPLQQPNLFGSHFTLRHMLARLSASLQDLDLATNTQFQTAKQLDRHPCLTPTLLGYKLGHTMFRSRTKAKPTVPTQS
jgi:hypothetical protein